MGIISRNLEERRNAWKYNKRTLINQMNRFQGSFDGLSDLTRVNDVPAESSLSGTNRKAPTTMPTMPPGNVQWHREEFPTCICHMKLQVTAEVRPPSSAGYLPFWFHQEFQVSPWFKETEWLFSCQKGREAEAENKISVKVSKEEWLMPLA